MKVKRLFATGAMVETRHRRRQCLHWARAARVIGLLSLASWAAVLAIAAAAWEVAP